MSFHQLRRCVDRKQLGVVTDGKKCKKVILLLNQGVKDPFPAKSVIKGLDPGQS